MPRRVPGQPFAHDVWLDATLTNVPAEQRQGVKDRLHRLPGWSTSFDGPDSISLRYGYENGRASVIRARAAEILRRAGAATPQLDVFVVWWVELNFRGPLDAAIFAPMTAAMRAMPGVLDTHQAGDNLSGVVVEFRGQPSDGLMKWTTDLASPHMAR